MAARPPLAGMPARFSLSQAIPGPIPTGFPRSHVRRHSLCRPGALINAIDYQILEFCLDGLRPLKALTRSIPSGTLYRHVKRLIRLAWLEKEGNLYRTTAAGRHQLAAVVSGQSWDTLTQVYPPLGLVPTPVHRALIELILADIVARQHEFRPDRHPFFVAFGPTLRWKTSLGRFVCHALGLDPVVQIVDCGSEAGRSLTFRRGSDGALVSKRELLDTSFVMLDEFQTADRRVRSTLGVFLGGRLVMPLENEQLTVRPVPLLAFNAKEAATLEGRLGLSAPLIRRALLADLGAVPMPDLATVGERAVDAAKTHPRLVLPAPRADVQDTHDAIVDLVRGVLRPDAHERVDVEVLANLCAGMTAFIPEPGAAIAQVVHGVGVLAETLDWARPGWLEAVSDLGRGPKRPPASTSALARVVSPGTPAPNLAKEATPSTSISLAVPPSPPRRRTSVPELDLSDELRARFIWFAMETQQDLQVALTTLLDFFLEWREEESTIQTLAAILRLSQQLELAEVEVETLHGYLKTREQLRKQGCDFEDVPEASRLIGLLEVLPFDWTWKQAETAMQAVAAMLDGEIKLSDVTKFLEQHRHLQALGFEQSTAGAVAEALARAGATGDRRDAVLAALVEVAGLEVDRTSLKSECQRLEASVNSLRAEKEGWKSTIQALRDQVARLKAAVARLNETRDRFQAQCDEAQDKLEVAEALLAFLMGRTADAERLWNKLETLLAWRRRGGCVGDAVGQMLTEAIRRQMLAFIQRLIQDIAKP
jgi:uncharacterized protein YoxC